MKNKASLLLGAMTAIGLSAASLPVSAATVYDFTSGGSPATAIGSGFGNALDFGAMTATAWGATGPDKGTGAWGDSLQSGQIYRWGTGLGGCNRSEGTIGGSPSCSTSSEHQFDNVSYDDFALFVFDNPVQLSQIVLDPYFTSDVDITFWVGNITNSNLTGLDDVTLLTTGGFASPVHVLFPGTTTAPQTINLGNAIGNALLIGGQRTIGSTGDNDSFKIASLTVTAVPVPAAVWLFGSGLLGLAGFARRKLA